MKSPTILKLDSTKRISLKAMTSKGYRQSRRIAMNLAVMVEAVEMTSWMRKVEMI